MKKLALVSLVTLFGAASLIGGIRQIGAVDNTIVPEVSNPAACQADRKSRETCKRWYELTEDPDPTAWLYDRRNIEPKGRWYYVGQAAKPKVQAKKIIIDKMIHFAFNKYNIKPDSYGILDDVASIIKANPQIKRIKVEGHTDWIGSEAYNMKLSQRRADSVVQYLTNKGVPASKLEAVGYGKTRPIATNKTAAGRAQNRRVEFNVVDQ